MFVDYIIDNGVEFLHRVIDCVVIDKGPIGCFELIVDTLVVCFPEI